MPNYVCFTQYSEYYDNDCRYYLKLEENEADITALKNELDAYPSGFTPSLKYSLDMDTIYTEEEARQIENDSLEEYENDPDFHGEDMHYYSDTVVLGRLYFLGRFERAFYPMAYEQVKNGFKQDALLWRQYLVPSDDVIPDNNKSFVKITLRNGKHLSNRHIRFTGDVVYVEKSWSIERMITVLCDDKDPTFLMEPYDKTPEGAEVLSGVLEFHRAVKDFQKKLSNHKVLDTILSKEGIDYFL